MKRSGIPRGVFVKSGRYYYVASLGKKRIWTGLSRVKDGLPALYTALADLNADTSTQINMPALVSDWQRMVMPRHAPKTQRDDVSRCLVIANDFVDFRPDEVDSPACATFLRQYRDKPRTHNAYREMLRELMRFAEEMGYRPAGSNPTQALRTMSTPARNRYITDSELRRIKVAAMRGLDGKDTRSGPMLCALIDMAYLTGQRIGDLLALEWDQLGRDGISFAPAKVSKTTGARILIEWSPKLRDVEHRLRALRVKRAGFAPQVFTTQDGSAYTYWGASTAWRRACDRAGIKAHFHDLRAKALTDKERAEGMQQARTMGGHSTETQTADYVRNRSARKTGATR